MIMEKFFFTYGTNGQPFYGGWTEVIAPNYHLACEAFRAVHPDKTEGMLNCSDIYSEEKFLQSKMSGPEGNFGHHCHETITLSLIHGEEPYECESMDCAYNHDGICRYARVHECAPTITDKDGCVSFVIDEDNMI